MSNGAWGPLRRAIRALLGRPRDTRAQRFDNRGDDHAVSVGRLEPSATRDVTAQELRQLRFEYDPHPDGDPDPGEIVWTWVPYVENDGRGKDRPVLILARLEATSVAGCYLTTKPRPGFVSVGTGSWDPQRRESFLSPERVLRVTHEGMRREGQQLSRDRFIEAARAVAQHWRLRA